MARKTKPSAMFLLEDKSFAYRGYLVKHNSFREEFYISKGGTHISTVRSKEQAKVTIDLLVWRD